MGSLIATGDGNVAHDRLSLRGLINAVRGHEAREGEDIEIPNESGIVDPRLKKANVGEHLKQVGQGYKQLNERLEQLKKGK